MAVDVARRFLDSLAVQDFEALGADLSDEVQLRALLPADTKEWHGREKVKTRFMRWFGDTLEYELVNRAVDDLQCRREIFEQERQIEDLELRKQLR